MWLAEARWSICRWLQKKTYPDQLNCINTKMKSSVKRSHKRLKRSQKGYYKFFAFSILVLLFCLLWAFLTASFIFVLIEFRCPGTSCWGHLNKLNCASVSHHWNNPEAFADQCQSALYQIPCLLEWDGGMKRKQQKTLLFLDQEENLHLIAKQTSSHFFMAKNKYQKFLLFDHEEANRTMPYISMPNIYFNGKGKASKTFLK